MFQPWLEILIFGSDFWDPHCRQNSDSVFGSGDSVWNFFEFQCLESQKIEILICKIPEIPFGFFFEILMSGKSENWNSDL
jgi:hypothetical protein